jgi:hypothetical protein
LPATVVLRTGRDEGRAIDPFFNIDTPADMEEAERPPAGET